MNIDADEVESFGKQVYEEFKAENVTFMAAAITYQAFVSLIPLVVLLFVLLTFVGDQALAQRVVQMTQSFLPEQGQRFLRQAITGDTASTSVSVVGLVTLTWGAFKIFKGLDTAFSEIFDTEKSNSIVDKLRDSAVVFVTLGLALIGAVVATWAFSALPIPFMGVLSPLLLVIGLCVALFPMYYVFPDMDLEPTDVLPGVVVGAVGWAALQALFQVYLAVTGDTGGSIIGAILLLLTWLYLSSLVLLLGAVVNAVLVGRTGDHTAPGGAGSSGGAGASGVRVTAGEGRGSDERDRGEANAASAVDPETVREERERLHRERDHLQRELRELRTEQRERESRTRDAEDEEGADDAAELRRENRALARRVRWYEKPAWKRALLRALGRDTPAASTDVSTDADARHT